MNPPRSAPSVRNELNTPTTDKQRDSAELALTDSTGACLSVRDGSKKQIEKTRDGWRRCNTYVVH
jgi:hypothetical protein